MFILGREAHRIKKEDMRGETTALRLRRPYHCAAYNALIAIISCTQTEEKFYSAFLFKDDPDKVEKSQLQPLVREGHQSCFTGQLSFALC